MKFNIKNLLNKKSIKKLEKATLVGVASLALIIPLGMSGNSSAHIASANGADVYGDQADQMIDNGLINTQGQWTASKWDHWLFNHNLMDSTGELDADGNEVNDLAIDKGISFVRAYHIYTYEWKRTHGQLTEAQLLRMNIPGRHRRNHRVRHAKHYVRYHANNRRGHHSHRKPRYHYHKGRQARHHHVHRVHHYPQY